MPRQARLDAPNALRHVKVRGLERRVLFRDDADREDFVARLAALAETGPFILSWQTPWPVWCRCTCSFRGAPHTS